MGLYRAFRPCFWSDTKIASDFSIMERYFYLYLLTNEHTNFLGCYEISVKQMANETDIDKSEVVKLLDALHTKHNVIAFCSETKEMLIYNWYKYNWTKSDDVTKGLRKKAEAVKNLDFQRYLFDILDGVDVINRPSGDGQGTMGGPSIDPLGTVPRPSGDGRGTSVSVTVPDNDTPDITDSSLSNQDTMDNNKEIPSVNCNTNGVNCNTKDYRDVINLYNSICTDLPKVKSITEARKRVIKARLEKYDINTLSQAFETAQNTDFLKHGAGTWPGANFDWLMNENNLVKVLEGNYRNGNNNSKNKGSILDNESMNDWEKQMSIREELYGANSELAQLFGTGDFANDYQ